MRMKIKIACLVTAWSIHQGSRPSRNPTFQPVLTGLSRASKACLNCSVSNLSFSNWILHLNYKTKIPFGSLDTPSRPKIHRNNAKLLTLILELKIWQFWFLFSWFVVYEDEMEELGMEMEIGCPTDVKHVAHIGWDGTTTTHLTANDNNPLIGWHHLFTPELLSRPDLPTPTMQHHLDPSPSPPFPVASS